MFFYGFFFIGCLEIITTQYNYPEKISSTRYSYTLYRDRKVENSPYTIETHTEYNECLRSCYNKKEWCKSIDAETINKNTVICRFFNEDSPKTMLANGFTYIASKPPNCSLSCSLTQNPCGKCKCNPSCSSRNRRQHICNCIIAAGLAKSCQEHYNNGFTKTGIFQIIPNGFVFETVCEMDKVEVYNPNVDTQICMEQSSAIIQFSFALSVSYCVTTCAKQLNIDTVFFDTPCFCGKYVDQGTSCNSNPCSDSGYCKLNASSTNCAITKVSSNQYISYKNKFPVSVPDSSSCVSFCLKYHEDIPAVDGYFASGIVVTNNDCLCLYGFNGQTVSVYYGCSYFETDPMEIVPSINEVNERVIQKGKLMKTLSLLKKIFSISFMLKPMSIEQKEYNVIHLTINENSGIYGDRIPGVWFYPLYGLLICFDANGDNDFRFPIQLIPQNIWSSVQISQTEIAKSYTLSVYLNDQLVKSITNTKPQFFKNVKVYASDPWHQEFIGSIRDFKIVNGYANFVNEVSERVVIKNNLIANLLYLDESYFVSFKIKPRSFSPGWKSVVHLTIGNDIDSYGDRSPAVFFHSNGLGGLYISSVVNGNKDYIFKTQPLPLNEWSSVNISQIKINGQCNYSLFINESMIHSVLNFMPQYFVNVKVYASNPWHDASDASIKDLKIVSGRLGIWIPMMTRFSSWESSFWNKSYETYENGFGLVNQQWIGLKNLNQITSTYFTDMRVDYSFKEDIKFSTMYYNVTVGSSDEKYVFRYEKFNPRGSGEPDRFNANGMLFKSCANWWTNEEQTSGNCDDKFPTSTNYISYGSAKQLASIQFFLRTNLEKTLDIK